MKKSLAACAALAALGIGGVHAQSSVTIFGVVDVGLTRGNGSIANRTQLTSSQVSGSRLGFRGSEDLGGGLRANFWLEAGVQPDDGRGVPTNTNNQASGAAPAVAGGQGLTFNRTSYVGLSSSSWGELRFGRDYTPSFYSQTRYDPTFAAGVGTSQSTVGSLTYFAHPAGVRASNAIVYITPTVAGGISAMFMHALGENFSNSGATSNDGKYSAGRVQYVSGPIDVSLLLANYKMSAVGDIRETIIGGSYAFGNAKISAAHVRDNTGTSNDMRGSILALTYKVGQWDLKTSVSDSRLTNSVGTRIATSNKFMFGAMYYLSKRTGIYSTYATVSNKDGANAVPFPGIATTAADTRSSGLDIGIRHIF